MFILSGIERRYGTSIALRIDRWEARSGERWLLAGPSGSGKSTALALLTRLLRPTAGTIVVAGNDDPRGVFYTLTDGVLERAAPAH
jgi:ABC-type sugar transport system ATPase subunit